MSEPRLPHPDKALGQHFLRNPAALETIARLAAAPRPDLVVEVGPGPGDLTAALAAHLPSVRLVAVELDSRWVEHVRQRLGARVECIHADAARVDWDEITRGATRAVATGNLPYNAAMPIYMGLLRTHTQAFTRLVLMFQREVAERIVAGPGSRRYGIPSVLTALYGRAGIELRLRPGSFWPPPRVHSAVVCVDVAPTPRLDVGGDVEGFERFVRAAFGARRKMLRNALAAHGWVRDDVEAAFAAAGVSSTARAEQLAPEELAALWRALPAAP